MKQTIDHNAAELRRLKQAIDDTVAHRSEGRQAFDAWREACAVFHARYDALAFPGGLAAAFVRLAAGDLTTADTAISFVELRPRFFRAQYHATRFIKLLKRISLRADLQRRFDATLAARREYKLRRNAAPSREQSTAKIFATER